jgi:protein arginine kinase activator
LIETVENTQTTLHICEHCAQKRHVGDVISRSALTLHQLLASLVQLGDSLDPSVPSIQCPHCQRTYVQFRETGQMGCSHCYDVFREALLPLLRQYHQSEEHKGRRLDLKAGAVDSEDVKALKDQIRKAVAEEQYELAAQLRDRMRELEGGQPT